MRHRTVRARLLSAGIAVVTTLTVTGLVTLAGPTATAFAAASLPIGNTPFGVADWDGNGTPDVIARDDSTGAIWAYPGENAGASRYQIGSYFGGYTPFGVADWTGDGHMDLIVRNDADGSVIGYTGHGGTAALSGSDRFPIGSFGGYTPFGVADWTGDGHVDLIARNDADGSVVGYTSHGGIAGLSGSDRFQIGSYFGGYTPFGVADWTGDGHVDLIVRNDADGSVVGYTGHGGTAALSGNDRFPIGSYFGGYTSFGLADWNGDKHTDLIIREDSTGSLIYYAGHGGTGSLAGTDRTLLGPAVNIKVVDTSQFPQVVGGAADEWYDLPSTVSDSSPVRNTKKSNEGLHYDPGATWGVDLAWGDPANWTIATKGTQTIVKGQPVALRVQGLWLKHSHQDFGVDLDFSDTPAFEWYIIGDSNDPDEHTFAGAPVNSGGAVALWNSDAQAYLVNGHETFGVDLNWYTPNVTTSGGGGGTSNPPAPGVKHLNILNCVGTPDFDLDLPRTISIWTRDATAGTAYAKAGDAPTAWSGNSCTGQPFTFTPSTAGHVYQVLAVDFSDCRQGDTPNAGCNILEPVAFTADPTSGLDVPITIG